MNYVIRPSAAALLASAALRRLHSYLDRHGDSLDRIFRQVQADPAASIAPRLRSLSDEDATEDETCELAKVLHKLQYDLIGNIGEPVVEIEGAYVGTDLDAGLQWHAAQLADIAQTLVFVYGT